jgi:hypothetical protein
LLADLATLARNTPVTAIDPFRTFGPAEWALYDLANTPKPKKPKAIEPDTVPYDIAVPSETWFELTMA